MKNTPNTQLQSQQMQVDNQGKRPLTLSPTYRYKKEQVIDNYNHILNSQLNKQITSPTNKTQVKHKQDHPRNQAAAQTSNEHHMLPSPGGATPTSMLSHQAPSAKGVPRHPATTEMGIKQPSKPLLTKHVNNSCLLNKQPSGQRGAVANPSLQPNQQQSASQSHPEENKAMGGAARWLQPFKVGSGAAARDSQLFVGRNTSQAVQGQIMRPDEQRTAVEANYGIPRKTILGHPNQHNLSKKGESQLIKAGKLATTYHVQPALKDEQCVVINSAQSQGGKEGGVKTTPFVQHMTLNNNSKMENTDFQYQATINSSNKYLFNRTAAYVNNETKNLETHAESSEYNKMGPSNINTEHESDRSISEKINQFNNKIGQLNQIHNIENKSFYNQSSKQRNNKGSLSKVNQQSVFLNTTKANLQSGSKSGNKSHYTTFNGPFEIHSSPNQHVVSGDLHSYNHQFQGNARQVLNPSQHAHSEAIPKNAQNMTVTSGDIKTSQQLQQHENQLKIKKFLNLVDLQDLVEKETQYRLNQAGEIVNYPQKSSETSTTTLNNKNVGQKQEAINKIIQNKASQLDSNQRHKIDPNLWKHFQNLLYFDHANNSALNQKLSLNQRKILINLRQQVLKNGFIGMNSEEITKTVKQFIEFFNLEEIGNKAQQQNQINDIQKDQHQQQQFVNAFQQQMMNQQSSNDVSSNNPHMPYNKTEKTFGKQGGIKQQHPPGLFTHAQPKTSSNIKPMPDGSTQINNFQGSNGARIININKLNINIQQYANQPVQQTTIQNGVQGVSYSGINQSNYQTRNAQIKQYPSGSGQHFAHPSTGAQAVPKQIQDTLFIMDCQLLGLLKNTNLLNLDTAKQMPLSQEKDTKMSEAELVHFFMTRANSAITMMFKELPKLSEEAKQIINMIKAQQQVDLQDEISKIDTLIIEIDYVDYKNKLLQALFNNYGDTVLETIIHKIQQGSTETDTIKQLNSRHFQTINEYVDSIRSLHVHQQRMTQQKQFEQNQSVFQQPNSNSKSSSVIGLQPKKQPEFIPQIGGEELSENLAYLYPNIYDPMLKSLNFTPGYRGKRYKDKKINFGVMVKETKLYHAVKCADQLSIKYNQMNQTEVVLGQSKKCLSSFLVTHDCTLLRFMLFCSHAGIIRSAQASLRLFFKNVFIVIKPGSQLIQSTGKLYHHITLPQVDVEKVTNYIQNQLKKKQKLLENQAQLKKFNSLAENNQDQDPQDNQNSQYSKIQTASRGNSTSNVTPALSKPYKQSGTTTGLSIDRNKSTVSLTSYKSLKNLEQVNKVDMSNHFNSLLSSIRADLVPEKPSTIKIYHKPYTHLNQSRFQKTFKIYNEFVSLTFKNKLIYAQPGEGSNVDIQDFTQVQAARICKLGSQMGIKDLPKKHSLLRAPLLELFRNHRQLQKIKEQVLRYLFRILNEENEISANFSHIVLCGNTFFVEKDFIKTKNPKEVKEDQQIEASTPPQNFIIQHQKTVSQVVLAQKNQNYKFQVGYGNNHFCIKSVMKNRRWWHSATTKDNVSNFEDAQIQWTQWCKTKLCNHLNQASQFKFEFKITLDKIETKCHFKVGEIGKKFSLTQNETKSQNYYDKQKGNVQIASPYKDPSKETKNQKIVTSRQIKKQPVFISTQYKSIENQINSPDKQNPVDEDKQQKLSKKKNAKKQKSMDEEDSHSEDIDGENMNQKSNVNNNENDNGTFKMPKLFRQVKAMREKFQKVYNRLEFNQHLNNKKALFINMRNYYNYCCEGDVFNTLPLTFHIKDGVNDIQFKEFTKYYNNLKAICAKDTERKNVWVLKPGENSNRGCGIKVESEYNKIIQIVEHSCSKYGTDGKKTVIVQKYIDNPMLYNRRKFDFRCFALVTCHNGIMKAYFYRDGYIRTASKEYSLANLNNKYIHLCNDAIQMNSDEYGKFETANKLSYQDFQKYLNITFPDMNINMERDMIMQIRKIVTDTIRATFHLLDNKKRLNSYELFGYDFMFDADLKPFLIEVNSNPCLEFSSSLLAKIFTSMLDNTIRISVDPLFQPSQEGFASKKSAEGIDLCPENRFDLIFDERIDGPGLLEKLNKIKLEDINEVKALDELEQSEDGEEPEVQGDQNEDYQVIISGESRHETTPGSKIETEKEDK